MKFAVIVLKGLMKVRSIVLASGRTQYQERRQLDLSGEELIALRVGDSPERLACIERFESGLAEYF